jgi:hypothetical protein
MNTYYVLCALCFSLPPEEAAAWRVDAPLNKALVAGTFDLD